MPVATVPFMLFHCAAVFRTVNPTSNDDLLHSYCDSSTSKLIYTPAVLYPNRCSSSDLRRFSFPSNYRPHRRTRVPSTSAQLKAVSVFLFSSSHPNMQGWILFNYSPAVGHTVHHHASHGKHSYVHHFPAIRDYSALSPISHSSSFYPTPLPCGLTSFWHHHLPTQSGTSQHQ